MRIRITTIALVLLAAAASASPAAEPAAAARFVTPYLDEQAVAIIHLDLTGLEVDDAFERIARAAGIDPKEFAVTLRAWRDGLAAFRKAGANDVYGVLSVADLPQPGMFVLAPRSGANDAELKAALGLLATETVEPLDGVMFAGGKSTLSRLRGLKPAARPDVEPAFAAVAGSPVQIAIIPTAEERRVLAELLPSLPKEVGGGPVTILTKGIRWAALGVQTTPKLVLKVVVQSDDAAAAKALADAVNHGLDTVTRDRAARRMIPKLDDLVAAVRPKIEGDRLTIAVDESNTAVVAALATGAAQARRAAARDVSINHLKQVAIAWYNYIDAHRSQCPDDIKSKDGKPLLSWRVAILPYISEDKLYKQFRLEEPWDSEHNKKLIERMPAIYRSPAQKVGGGKTCYLAPSGMADKAHIGAKGATFPKDFPDGTSNTILLVEANDDAAVDWTKPEDLAVDPKNPFKGLLGHYEQGFLAAIADGSARFISRSMAPTDLLAAFTRDGGEVVNW
jgi:hypothetical protein